MWKYAFKLQDLTSPDSIVPEPGSVIGYNRYAYVNNNPMIYTDPSGHIIAEDIDWPWERGYEPTESRSGAYLGDEKNAENNSLSNSIQVIIACGYGAGGDCEKKEEYSGQLPLSPYYNLSTLMPLIYGPDKYGDPETNANKKQNTAKEINEYIIKHPGKYTLVGHSAGGRTQIIVAMNLIANGYEDRINAVILIEPYMDEGLPVNDSYVDIRAESEKLVDHGFPVLSAEGVESNQIKGAIPIKSAMGLQHLELAVNENVYNEVVSILTGE